MNLSPEVAAVLRQALADAQAMPSTVSSYLVLKGSIEKLLPKLQDVDKYLKDK